jgi:hypothetical protein
VISSPGEESIVLTTTGGGGIVISSLDGDSEQSSISSTASRQIQRAKNLSEGFDIEELYEAYREIETTYLNKTLTSSDWKVLNVNDGVEVSLLNHEDDPTCPYVRMQAIFPVPVQDIWDFLRVPNWDSSMPKMDPFYEGYTIHGNFSHPQVDMLLCRKRTKRILAFGKRDLVFLAVTQKHTLDDGTWVSGTVSVETTQIPRQPGYTRAFQDSIAFYTPTDTNHTHLTMICRIDLNDSNGDGGGWIPMWLYVRTIGYTGVNSFARMRQALLDATKDR